MGSQRRDTIALAATSPKKIFLFSFDCYAVSTWIIIVRKDLLLADLMYVTDEFAVGSVHEVC
jgi:hypothetical protein